MYQPHFAGFHNFNAFTNLYIAVCGVKEKPFGKFIWEMADEILFELLHSELVSYVLTNSEKDKKVNAKRAL